MPNEAPDEDSSSQEAKSFPTNQQFQLQVSTALKELKGTVFPKLNWSAPQDATWCVPLLRCSSFSDIFLALQCSSLLHYDLEIIHNYKEIEPHLVLKEWKELPQGNQFRCFVKQKQLLGISQRDCSLYFPSIQKAAVLKRLLAFFEQVLYSTVPLSKYVVDVSVEAKRVWIVDINPWSPATNTLLFTWEELQSLDSLQFRIVESPTTVKANSFDQFRAPVEFQAPNLGQSVPQFLQEMKKSYK